MSLKAPERETDRSSLYPWIAAGILLSITALIVGAIVMGKRRFDDRSIYFYQLGDVGHPGVVNAFTAMGFIVCAAMCTIVAMSDRRDLGGRHAWLIAAVLMGALGVDDLLRLHNAMPSGDVIARLVYWCAALYVVSRLRNVVRARPGSRLLVAGFVGLAASELFDLLGTASGGTPNDNLSILEESAACFGAWSLVAAGIGLVPALLGGSERGDEQQ